MRSKTLNGAPRVRMFSIGRDCPGVANSLCTTVKFASKGTWAEERGVEDTRDPKDQVDSEVYQQGDDKSEGDLDERAGETGTIQGYQRVGGCYML